MKINKIIILIIVSIKWKRIILHKMTIYYPLPIIDNLLITIEF